MSLETNILLRNLPQAADSQLEFQNNCKRVYLLVLLISDMLMLALAFWLAYFFRFEMGITLSPEVVPSPEHYLRIIAILIPGWLMLFVIMGLYDYRFLLGGTQEYARAVNAVTSSMMLVIIASFVYSNFYISRAWLVMAWIFSCLFVCVARLILRRMAYLLRHKNYFISPSIIIGTNEEAVALASQLRNSTFSGMSIVGFVQGDTNDDDIATVQKKLSLQSNFEPLLGSTEDIESIITKNNISEVIIASTSLTSAQLFHIFQCVSRMPGVNLRLSSGLYEVFTTHLQVNIFGGVPLMSLDPLRLNRAEIIMKWLLDCIVVLICLPILLPIMLFIALLIKLDSPGPILYRRRVLGIGGKEFDAFKLRSMYQNADEILAKFPDLEAELREKHKIREDPRVTRIGRWLRRSSLDEIPQFINVMKGQMSLVGPRMISPGEVSKYGKMYANLLTVKPGMTGLWQVSGRSDLSYEERVALDMHYIRNYSIWSDIQILFFQTPRALLKREGAY